MKHTAICAALLIGLVAAGPAKAAESALAGTVKRLVGSATLVRGTQQQTVSPGLALQVGDLLRTGPASGVSITLADDTLLSTGPGSELQITQFSFNSTTHEGGMLLSLWRGTLSVVTGLLARKAPEKVNVQTRTVVLGVRGTEFIVETGEVAQ